jgi:endonuclease III
MKNSKEYADRLQKLYRTLKRAHPKTEPVTYEDPIDALIYGILSEQVRDSVAQTAVTGIKNTFIDWNDLRVSRVEEIVEVFGEDTPDTRNTGAALTMALRAIFDTYHTLSLQALRKMGKRPAKQVLDQLQGASRFCVNYCMLTSLQAHAIPLTESMVEYLKRNEIVDPQAEEEDIEGFLGRQVPAKDGYEFYALLRRESESPKVGKKKKTTKKTARRKTRKVAKAKK